MDLAEVASKVNWIDLVVLILFIKIGYTGIKRGFIHEIIPFSGIFTCVVISLHNFVRLGQVLSTFTPFPKNISELISFSIMAIIILVVFALIYKVMGVVFTIEVTSFIDRTFGALLGMLRAILTISFILIIFVLVPIKYLDMSIKDRSLLGRHFLRAAPSVYDKLVKLSGRKISEDQATMTSTIMAKRWRN